MLSHYIVELWTHRPLSAEGVHQAATTAAKALDGFSCRLAQGAAVEKSVRIVHDAAPQDGGPPPEWTIELVPMDELTKEDRAEIEQALMQSWWFPEARKIAGTCSERVIITDHLHTGLDYKRRLADLQAVTAALIEAMPCDALWWVPTQQFLPPNAALQSFQEDQCKNPLPGAINVRSYEVPEESLAGEGAFRLMDTLGLYAFGLNDLQISFRGLDPESVSQVLFHTALYLFEHGPVLRNSETIQGPGPNDRWLVTSREALSDPQRDVWSLDPGAPFAAGLSEAIASSSLDSRD